MAVESGDTPPSSVRRTVVHDIWAFIRIMNVRLRFIFLMVLVGLIAGHWDSIMNHYDRWRRPVQASEMVQVQEVEYYCAMHPNIIRAEPGNCPICGMPLVKRAKTAAKQLPEGVLGQVELTPLKVEIGRIGTTPVGYRLLSREIRTVGVVEYDETRLAYISARIKGRIDKLMVNYVGQHIKKGDPLVWIYSPDLLVAQRELLTAERSAEQQKRPGDFAGAAARSLADAARQKLLLWGITEEQVNEIVRRGTPETHLTIYSPIAGLVTEKNVLEGDYVVEGTRIYTIADLTVVWMQAKVFEDQIAGVSVGTAVEVTSTAYPNEVFAGRITFISYTVDPATRTLSCRVEIANPDLKLRPGMYANAVIRLPVGKVTEVSAASAPATTTTHTAEGQAVRTDALAKAYLAVAVAYSHDHADAAAVSNLTREARAMVAQTEGSLHSHAVVIAELAERSEGKDLKGQREVFKSISARMIELLRLRPPGGVTLYTFHCPMAKADWLSDTKAVVNPYYGHEMLTCGEVTGTIKTGAAVEEGRFEMGYYCPIYPDRLYEKAHLCPLDKFPMKYVRVEKVLAVPECAVINTGTRKIVYRQSAPDTFDMLEVQVGPRAGEFYPIVSGLKPGDRVATAGAFLVDAENRLNPAASAQYFGASGGPSGGEHKH